MMLGPKGETFRRMIDIITDWNTWLNGYVWGLPMIVLLMGTGSS
jgi:hypothetical protein